MWEAGWKAIKDHPILGIGVKNDGEVMPRYRDPITERTGHVFFNRASTGIHNLYLQTWLNTGIFGLLSYLGIWAVFFYLSLKTLKQFGSPGQFSASLLWGGMAAIAGIMTAGIFENNFRDGEVQIAVLLIVGLSLYAINSLYEP